MWEGDEIKHTYNCEKYITIDLVFTGLFNWGEFPLFKTNN